MIIYIDVPIQNILGKNLAKKLPWRTKFAGVTDRNVFFYVYPKQVSCEFHPMTISELVYMKDEAANLFSLVHKKFPSLK